jgi:hypothetical protein
MCICPSPSRGEIGSFDGDDNLELVLRVWRKRWRQTISPLEGEMAGRCPNRIDR